MPVLTGQRERMRTLWRLSWPAIIEQVLGTMVSYVDAAMVGVLGAAASAAVSVNSPPIWLLNGTLVGVGVGYSVQVSNAVGANDPQRVQKIIRQAFLAALVCGALACGLYEALGGFRGFPPSFPSGWGPSRRCFPMPSTTFASTAPPCPSTPCC